MRVLKFWPLALLLTLGCSGDVRRAEKIPEPKDRPASLKWQVLSSQLYSVYFINSTTGWAVGKRGVILATTDGGKTWIKQASGTSDNLSAVSFVNATTGWAVGDGGLI